MFLDVFLPNGELAPLDQWAVPRALRGETATNSEYTLRRKDTGETWVGSYSFAPIRGQDDVIVGSVVVGRDITEQKKAEKALQESELFLKETQRIARLGGWKANPLTGYLKWTDGVYDILEAPRDYSPGMEEGGKFYLSEYVPFLREKIVNCLRNNEPFAEECQVKTTSGKILWTEVRGLRPLLDGGEANVIGTLQDITKRKQAEAEILRQREELRGLAARLSEVEETQRQQLALELHDQVCQNLTSMSIFLEIFKVKAKKEPVNQLLDQLSSMIGLVEQTNEITRGIMEGLRPTALNHYGLMGGLREFGSKFSQRTGIKMEIQGEEATPRLPANTELALFRIAQEALHNVVKHAQARQVVVTGETGQNGVRLTIADNGTGFDPTSVAKPKEGRGWGLTSMTERAMAVGGTCRIESRPGQGTRVTVEVSR
jgi:signal transduction histidine kinase